MRAGRRCRSQTHLLSDSDEAGDSHAADLVWSRIHDCAIKPERVCPAPGGPYLSLLKREHKSTTADQGRSWTHA
jgi:hypothetical protein